jgi:hypothetical protein
MAPFRPKSTAYLKAGQYWSFRIKGGMYVCGVVIARRRDGAKINQRLFLAGLLDWSGTAAPKAEEIEGRGIIERGFAHIKSITETGGEIIGEVRPLWGYNEEIDATDSIPTWGYSIICAYAEKHFGKETQAKDDARRKIQSRRPWYPITRDNSHMGTLKNSLKTKPIN